jgi:hypothetical protein
VRRLLVWAETKAALDLDTDAIAKARELGMMDMVRASPRLR